ncbi:MAG: hypothetical protein J1G06_04610 [Oscillospiraceae bacterium]|nr:hypothetical protein [Oscillospiraceae bacterium]
MTSDSAVVEIENKLVDAAINSALILICLFLAYIQGVWILNIIVSFKRKKRNFIFHPLLALSAGAVCSGICFTIQNLDLLMGKKITVDILASNILAAVILSLSITGFIGLIVYVLREYFYMKGIKEDEQ